MTTSRRQRFALIAALYCTQNLSLGFYTYAFLTIAQARGVPLAAIGAAAGVAMVLTAKFLWAPVVDRFGSRRLGHYRGWLILTQSGIGLGAASLALFDPAADFGVMLAAGWQVAALSLSGFSLVALPFILAWRETADDSRTVRAHVTLRSAVAVFARAEVRWWCLLLIPLYTAGGTVAYNLVRPILVDDGWTEGRIGLYVVIAGSGVGIVAGLLAGALISTVGRHRSLAVLGALQVLAALATIAIAQGWTAPGVVLAVVGTSTAAFTAATAIAYTIVMGLARPESAGSFGFTPVLVAAAILALVGLVVVLVMAPRISG